jgi:mono/diheme cytochrome c family protein
MQSVKSILVFIVVVLLLCAALIYSGAYNVAADEPHLKPVSALLGVIRSRSIAVRLDNITPPRNLDSEERLVRGGELYGSMCAGCHLGPGVQETGFYKGLNPQPPRLARHGGDPEPRELFWVIKHGIKMTGMPAWGLTHDDEAIWDTTAFVMQLPDMSAEEFSRLSSDNP